MIQNWILIAWRNLYLNLRFSLINILGLSIGIACCILMLLFAKYESSYDSSYTGSDRIYKLYRAKQDGVASSNLRDPFSSEIFNSLLPESGSGVIEIFSHYEDGSGARFTVKHQSNLYVEEYLPVGKDFFKLLDVGFVEGDSGREFYEPGTVIISEVIAKKYFGKNSVLGNTLTLQDGSLLEVVGVVENFPSNSHINDSIFVNPKTHESIVGAGWDTSLYINEVLIRISEKSDPEFILKELIDEYQRVDGGIDSRFRMMPIAEVHLDEPAIELMVSDGAKSWSLSNRMVLSVTVTLALLVLAIAIFNFVNMSVARASQRGREIGVRKVFGASRGQLLGQYLCEAIVLSVLATIVAVLLVCLLLPWFNFVVNRTLALPSFTDIRAYVGLLVLALGVGLSAGVYPALVLSRQSPIAAIRGGETVGGQGTLRKILVVTQFSIATLLIVVALMAYQQLELFRHQSLGYNKDVYVLTPDMRSLYAYNQSYRESLGENVPHNLWGMISLRLRAELLQQSDISAVSLSGVVPGNRSAGAIEIARSGDGEQQYVPVGILNGMDEYFLELYELPLQAGRNFSRKQPLDAAPPSDPKKWRSNSVGGAIILTQSTAKALGYLSPRDALGQEVLTRSPLRDYEILQQKKQGVHVPRPSTSHRVIGVAGDMLLGDGIGGMKTAAFTFNDNGGTGISIKVRPGQDKKALEQIQEAIKKAVPGIFVTVDYLPEKLERSLQPFNRLMLAFIGFAILAVGISCMGLYAMATFTVARRTKEVGVRKVLGASSGRLVRLLGWDFTKPVLLSIALALPLAYIVCTYMLQAFAHKVPIGIALLGTSALLSVVIAWLTVSGQTWLAANANPSESLRSE